jgi:tetratricopeptide (TPR) repeat protein
VCSLTPEGKYKEALECFQKAHQIDVYAPEPMYDEATTLLQLGRYQTALEAYKLTEQLAPGWYKVRLYIWLTEMLVKLLVL